jgi:hypothetical protein
MAALVILDKTEEAAFVDRTIRRMFNSPFTYDPVARYSLEQQYSQMPLARATANYANLSCHLG